MKPDPSSEKEQFIDVFLNGYDVGIEDHEEVTWKEICEAEKGFTWDLYCLEVEGRELGFGWDHCIEVGDFYPMR